MNNRKVFLTEYSVIDWRGEERKMAGEDIMASNWEEAEKEAGERETIEDVIGVKICNG